MTFEELGLSENILKAIKDCGYDTPTPIQAEAIPHALMARDVVGLAQTGTGKTASFTLPLIEILDGGRARARMPRSLVLAPTRELAAQVAENFETYSKYTNLSMALLTGGVSMGEQIKKLDRGVDVLIATPGRLLDLFERGKVLLTGVKVLVIDEADRMLDMGFVPDIDKIVALLSPIRQTLLFSATMPPEIRALTKKYQSNPREVSVAPAATTAKNVKEMLVWVKPRAKRNVLLDLIRDEKVKTAFVFCNRKRDIDGLAQFLEGKGFNTGKLHGDMDQSSRTKTLESFKNDEITLLICSDVAGRGIDVDDLSHVFNYDVPMHADDYVHRVGRTGRAGKEGRAWSLATVGSDEKYVDAIEKLIKKPIEVVDRDGQSSGNKTSSGGSKSKNHGNKNNTKAKANSSGDDKHQSKSRSNKSTQKKSDIDNPYLEDEQRNQKRVDDEENNVSRQDKRSSNKSSKNKKSDNNSPLGFGDDVPNFFSRAS